MLLYVCLHYYYYYSSPDRLYLVDVTALSFSRTCLHGTDSPLFLVIVFLVLYLLIVLNMERVDCTVYAVECTCLYTHLLYYIWCCRCVMCVCFVSVFEVFRCMVSVA